MYIHTPHPLIDHLLDKYQLRSDAELSRFLETNPPVISKIRNRKMPITPLSILMFYDKTDLSIEEIRALIPTEE